MQIFDLVYFSDDYEKKIEIAKQLGFNGLIFFKKNEEIENLKSFIDEINEISSKKNFFCYPALEFKNFKDMRKYLNVKKCLILIKGYSENLINNCVKNYGIDIIYNPVVFSHAHAKFCKENEIFYGINFREIILNEEKSKVFNLIKKQLLLVKKFEIDFVIFSGAQRYFEMKHYYTLANFLTLFNIEIKIAKNSFGSYKKIFHRRSEKFIIRGLEIL